MDAVEKNGGVGLNSQQNQEVTPVVPNHFTEAVLSVFLFWPAGILSIIYALKVNKLVAADRLEEAKKASSKARTWAIGSLVVALLWMILYFVVEMQHLLS